MRVVVWNMARAFVPAGSPDPWNVLASLEPEVALLQECRPPKDGSAVGHLHHLPTRHGWGTAVWSRWPLSNREPLPSALAIDWEAYRGALEGYVASATVEPPGGPAISFTSVHAYPAPVRPGFLTGFDIPTLRLPHQKDVWPGDLLWWAVRRLPSTGAHAIVAGDWNTARLIDEFRGPRGNREFFGRMSAAGWTEVARKFHPNEVQTYFKPRNGPFQLDHAFATEWLSEATRSFEVVRSDGVAAASDHAAIVMDVDLSSLAGA